MKSIDTKSKTMWGIIMIGLLGGAYWLCRFYFFEMHGMKQWPNLLVMLSIATITVVLCGGRY